MGEQWDREKEDHAVGIMSEQYKWAAIDRQWTRDEDDEPVMIDLVDNGDEKPGGGQVYKYDQELGKMIGSLNDNNGEIHIDGKHSGIMKTRGGGNKNKASKLKFDGQENEAQHARINDKENMLQYKRKPEKTKNGAKNLDVDTMNEDAMHSMKTQSKMIISGTKPSVVEQPIHQETPNVFQQGGEINNGDKVIRKGDKKTKLQEILRRNSNSNIQGKQMKEDNPKVYKVCLQSNGQDDKLLCFSFPVIT